MKEKGVFKDSESGEWRFRIRRGSYHDQQSGFPKKIHASEAYTKSLSKYYEETKPKLSPTILQGAVLQFLEDGVLVGKSQSRTEALRYNFNNFIMPYFGADRLLTNIRAKRTDHDQCCVEGFIAAMVDRKPSVSKNTVRHYVMDLQTLINWAINREEPLLQHNVIKRASVHRLSGWKPKKLSLDLEMVDRCAEVLAGRDRVWYDFARYTGYRMSEVNRLQWRMVDLDRGLMLVPGTKTEGSEEELPMAPVAIRFLLGWRHRVDRNCPWVFPSPDNGMQKRCGRLFERLQEGTGGTKVGYHYTDKYGQTKKAYKVVGGTHLKAKDLRDYFCARTCQRISDPDILMKLLRHKSLATTTQYISVTMDRMRMAVEGLGDSVVTVK